MIDPAPLWNFDDPEGSEQRFRAEAEDADPDDRLVLMTQVARALGLQERYDEAHTVLDDLSPTGDEVAVRIVLERGRLFRSAGGDEQAHAQFEVAAQSAAAAGLEALHVDALHMLALVADPADRVSLGQRALAVARASSDQRARDWDASLLNNIGMAQADAGDLEAALVSFEEALAARQRIGDPERTRVARWMVGWTLRNLGRRDAARAVQRDLKAELDAAGLADPHVDEELALLE